MKFFCLLDQANAGNLTEKDPTNVRVMSITNDVLSSVSICPLGTGVKPSSLYTWAVEKLSV